MELAAAFTELAYAKDWTPSSRRWFSSRLGAFFAWAEDQGIMDLERITTPVVRRYVDERRTTPSRTGQLYTSPVPIPNDRSVRRRLHKRHASHCNGWMATATQWEAGRFLSWLKPGTSAPHHGEPAPLCLSRRRCFHG
jgi:hypothetical protein